MGILIWNTGIQGILVGVTGSHLTGPCVIECDMTAVFFSEFLTQFTVTFGIRRSSAERLVVWFQHDDTPPHVGR